MIAYKNSTQRGAINNQLLIMVGLLLLIVGLSGLSAWLYVQYNEQKTNVDGKIAIAAAEARKDQSEIEAKNFAEREKEPRREFAGPEDYGSLSFKYPKTWSVYVADDPSTSSSRFSAFLHPIVAPPVSSGSARFALTVHIETIAYDRALDKYRKFIQKGELRSSPITVNGHEGTRLDGMLRNEISGSAALFRVRDKTITITSEAETFKEDFDTIIQTIDFID